MREFTSNGIEYTWELAGPDGASFLLFPTKTDTPESIAQAKQFLRDTQDVVSVSVADDYDRDQAYKTAYFRDPRTRNLHWYEMEQDEKKIRNARINGITPTDFVTRFVLPCTEEVKARNFEKFGDKMYGR